MDAGFTVQKKFQERSEELLRFLRRKNESSLDSMKKKKESQQERQKASEPGHVKEWQPSTQLQENERFLKKELHGCEDVKWHPIEKEGKNVALLLFADGMIDQESFTFRLMPQLKEWMKNLPQGEKEVKENIPFPLNAFPTPVKMEELMEGLFSGMALLLIDGMKEIFFLPLSHPPKRNPEESKTQISILGPRDGFTEEIGVNIALIRKRLKTSSLKVEFYDFGHRSHTRVALLYMGDILNPGILQQLKERLADVDLDLLSSHRQLADFLIRSPFNLFPIFSYSGRPDYAVESLIRGRFILLVDGVPLALIGPINFYFLLHSPEDPYYMNLPISFARILRIAAFLISIFMPGFWIALSTHHQDMIPLPLLATTIVDRKGVPFPAGVEAFVMAFLFSLLVEAGFRLPSGIGQTLSVVGGLIIGDAAIAAGITSPILVVVISISAVASFALVNQNLVLIVSILRLFSLAMGTFFGIFGFLLSAYYLVIILANMRPFGLPYLAPLPGSGAKDLSKAFLVPKRKWVKRRPIFLKTVDPTRKKEGSEP